jgi:hypothetical protein
VHCDCGRDPRVTNFRTFVVVELAGMLCLVPFLREG